MVKVLRKMKTEHLSKSDRHIRIAGKVEIDLERKCQRTQPCQRHTHIRAAKPFDIIPEHTNLVRKQHLFSKSDQKTLQTVCHIRGCLRADIHLALHILITHDRSGNQLWKQAHIHAKRDNVFLRRSLPTVHIDRVRHRLERIK